MKAKLGILALTLLGVTCGFGAVYNVTTGTVATSVGIAPTSLVSNPSAAAAVGTFSGYQDPGSPGVVAYGVFGTYSGANNTGTFSSLSDGSITGAESLSTLVGAFQQFGAAGVFNQAGAFGTKGVFTRNTSAIVAGSIFSGLNIYAFIGNGTTFANSTQLLVLKNNTLFADSQDAIPTAQTVTLTKANSTLLFGVNLADVRTTTADASVTPGWGTAAVIVPEPSAALLGAIGALGLLRRRRI